MKRTALLTILMLFLFALPDYGIMVNVKDLFGDLITRYHLEFRVTIDPQFFPPNWQKAPISVRAHEMDQSELSRFPKLLVKALSRYPDQLIKDNLKGVYLTKDLYCYNVRFGATYANGIIYLSSTGDTTGYTDYYLLCTFHHEFNSILMNNYNFPRAKWIAANPHGARYRYASEGGFKALIEGKGSLEGNDALYRNGFVNEYAATHMEEDFSEFSAYALTYPLMMRELIKKYPVMKNKFDALVEFYQSFDARVTVDSLLKE